MNISDELVEQIACANQSVPTATEVKISAVDLSCYDQLLEEVAP
jgi:hypothetical protein